MRLLCRNFQILGIINLIIITATWRGSAGANMFNLSLSIGWFYTLSMLLMYLFHTPEKLYTLPWFQTEIIVNGIVALFYFIASIMLFTSGYGPHSIAGVFGFITLAFYLLAGYLKFKAWRNGELPQGELSSHSATRSYDQENARPAAF